MTWALGDSRSHNIGWAQQKFILNQKWYSQDWAQIIVECMNELQEEVGPMSSTTVSASALLPPCTATGRAIWEIPQDPLMDEKSPKLGSLSLVWDWKAKKNGGNNTTSSEVSLIDNDDWKSSQWAELWEGQSQSLQGHQVYVKRNVTQGNNTMDLRAVIRT